MAELLIRLVPLRPKPGEEVTVAVVARHPMEPGTRHDNQGKLIAANYLQSFEVVFEGESVASLQVHGGLSANPLLSFRMKADKAGTLLVRATDLEGNVSEETARLELA